jgi:putative membrane protein
MKKQNEVHFTAGANRPRGGWLYSMLKGALIGTGAILPGISGGVLCVVFGIYRPVMELLAHPIRELKKNLWYFVPILVGFAVGVLGISKLLQWVLTEAETPAVWLFVGLIVGTMPSLWRDAGKEGRQAGSLWAGGITLVVMLAFLLWVKNSGTVQFVPSIWVWALCGVMWGLGFIAPGLSPSSLFFFMGVMEPMMAGISALSIPVLLPMGLGLIACVLLLSRGMECLLHNRYAAVSHAILGLAIASTVVILPLDAVHSVSDVLIYALCFAAGLVIALWMDRMNRKLEAGGLK